MMSLLSAWVVRKFVHVGENEVRAARRTVTYASSAVGFTLVELLVVVVILGVLGSVVALSISGPAGTASAAACRSDVRVIASAQEAYLFQTGSYAGGVDELVRAHLLRSTPASDGYEITTDGSGAVTAAPDCDALDGSTVAATPTSEPHASALAAACTAGVDAVLAAQDQYHGATGGYGSNVALLVKKGYLDADPSADGFTVKTSKSGTVSSSPSCANISDVACAAAVAEVSSAQRGRFAATGKYAGNVAQLVSGGDLAADPSTDAYKIKTTKTGSVTATPDCAALA